MTEVDPKVAAIAEWEAQRHANEVAFWAERLDEFVMRLPNIRRMRLGDERAAGMVRDVIEAVRMAEGPDAAVLARDRLMDVWRGEKPRVRV